MTTTSPAEPEITQEAACAMLAALMDLLSPTDGFTEAEVERRHGYRNAERVRAGRAAIALAVGRAP